MHHFDMNNVMKASRGHVIHDHQDQVNRDMTPHLQYNVWMTKVPIFI